MEKKLKKLEPKINWASISCQTSSSVNLPYLITEPLPPIFSSRLCVQTKPIFMANSMPDLSTLVFIEDSEEMRIRDAAEDALNYQYDREVARFYEEARCRAAGLRGVYEEGASAHLFELDQG